MNSNIKRALSIFALFVTGIGATSAAHAQLTSNGVTFTSSFSGNVLTLEIDAASPTNAWQNAVTLGALQIKDVGTWDSVVMAGPGVSSTWALGDQELGANGCDGGIGGIDRICAFGTPVTLTNNMIFTFTFTGGTQDLSSPLVKVNMFNANGVRVGGLLSSYVPAIPEPGTYAMLLGGLGILALARRNVKKAD